jgi:hypothetical protein
MFIIESTGAIVASGNEESEAATAHFEAGCVPISFYALSRKRPIFSTLYLTGGDMLRKLAVSTAAALLAAACGSGKTPPDGGSKGGCGPDTITVTADSVATTNTCFEATVFGDGGTWPT